MNQVAPVIRPYVPPRIASASIDALNALARHGGELDWPDADGAGTSWRLSIDLGQARGATVAAFQAQGVSDSASVALRLWTQDASLRLVVPRAALSAWLAAAFPGVGRVDLEGWAMDAAIDCLLAFLRPRLRALGLAPGWQLDREGIQATAIALAGCGLVHVAAPHTGEAWPLVLQADTGGLALLGRCLSRRNVAGQDVWLEDVPIPLRAMVGYTDLTSGDLRRLAPGDVVLLDRALGDGHGHACLIAPDGRALRLAAVVRHRADSGAELPAAYLILADWISIMSPEEKENTPEDDVPDLDMPDIDADDDVLPPADAAVGIDHDALPSTGPVGPAGESALADVADANDAANTGNTADDMDAGLAAGALDAIPVRLGFDLGARGMPLGEVRRLRPGQTLVLDREVAAAPVAIRANGRCIGHGELVDIDGRLGVRIIDLRRKRT
ncbi:type III secretion system cytoplasmic ring protein SctQ [Achromobacter aloeverae]|nr:type III secretion system cytoplasmic ring protein SctQ [Achromobacter aloeverae]